MTRRPDPWERQPAESPQAWQAFAVYRDLGTERSHAKVAAAVGKSRNLMDRWAIRWTWLLRVTAYDRDQDRIFRVGQAAQRRRMGERHARIAGAMQSKLIDRLQSMDVSKMTLRDMAYWLETTSKVEARALGVPDKIEVSGPAGGPVEVAFLSDEDRAARLLELKRELDERVRNRLAEVKQLHGDPDDDDDAA